MKNLNKQKTYIKMHEDLKKSLEEGFYLEAIFIEYAILEDRVTSVLKYAQLPMYTSDGHDININKKIRMIQNELNNDYVNERLTTKLIKDVCYWIKDRNTLIHDLANLEYDSDAIRDFALDGRDILKEFTNKAQQVINHYKKENKL